MHHTAPITAPPPLPRHDPGCPYPRISRAGQPHLRDNLDARGVWVGPVLVGAGEPAIIAGPCAVESHEQTLTIARAVRAAGANLLRGGAYKPRTSPYDFQGLGLEGLEILAEARAETGLPIVTEVLDVRQVEEVASYADCLQIGARSMQNFPLLTEVGKAGRPVLLKRHWAATLKEWLCAAEYIAVQGNADIILCERGIRTFSAGEYNRSTLDLNIIQAVRERTYLPIVLDPSHGTGVASLVSGASLAGVCAGAHGLIIEVIAEDTDPSTPLCDGDQSIRPSMLARITEDLRAWRGLQEP